MSQNSCILIPMYFAWRKQGCFYFNNLNIKEKSRTKVSDNLNLDIYISSCSAECSHAVFTNQSQERQKCRFWCKSFAEGTHSWWKIVIVVDNSVVFDRTADNKSGGQLIRGKCYMWREHRKLDFAQVDSELPDVSIYCTWARHSSLTFCLRSTL